MKNLLLVLLFVIASFAGTPPGTNIGAVITPTDSADIYPTHNAIWGKGGFRTVANTTIRDAIPALRRDTGMTVYCLSDSTVYQLRGGIANANWTSNIIFGEVTASNLGYTMGTITEPTMSYVDDNHVTVSNFDVLFKYPIEGSDRYYRKTVTGGTVTITPDVVNFMVARWNGGSPVAFSTLSVSAAVADTNVPICRLFVSTKSHAIEYHMFYGKTAINSATNNFYKNLQMRGQYGIEKESGLTLSEVATLKVRVGSGFAWFGLRRIADTILTDITQGGSGVLTQLRFHKAGVWADSTINTYENLRYDNGTTLVALTNNRYTINWVFRNLSENEIDIIVGTGDYNSIASAQASSLPVIPQELQFFYIPVGRIIIQKGATSASVIETFQPSQTMGGSVVTNHNDLNNLDYSVAGHTGFARGTNNKADSAAIADTVRRLPDSLYTNIGRHNKFYLRDSMMLSWDNAKIGKVNGQAGTTFNSGTEMSWGTGANTQQFYLYQDSLKFNIPIKMVGKNVVGNLQGTADSAKVAGRVNGGAGRFSNLFCGLNLSGDSTSIDQYGNVICNSLISRSGTYLNTLRGYNGSGSVLDLHTVSPSTPVDPYMSFSFLSNTSSGRIDSLWRVGMYDASSHKSFIIASILGTKTAPVPFTIDTSGLVTIPKINATTVTGITSGTSILKGNNAGGFTNATAGTEYIAGGVGAAGTIAKFSGSGVLANSLLSESTNLINLTGVEPVFRINDSSIYSALLGLAKSGVDKWYLLNERTTPAYGGVASNDFVIYDNTNAKSRFVCRPNGDVLLCNNGGSVGIGTTSPATTLSVNGCTTSKAYSGAYTTTTITNGQVLDPTGYRTITINATNTGDDCTLKITGIPDGFIVTIRQGTGYPKIYGNQLQGGLTSITYQLQGGTWLIIGTSSI